MSNACSRQVVAVAAVAALAIDGHWRVSASRRAAFLYTGRRSETAPISWTLDPRLSASQSCVVCRL